jgi:PAS domain S-box-containing protein
VKLSLRAKFLLLGGLVHAVVVGALVWNCLRLLDQAGPDPAALRTSMLDQSLAIAAGGFGIALLPYYLFTARIGRRLALFRRRAERLAQGQFDEMLPEDGGDELHVFSRSINAMSGALRARIHQLDTAEQRLRESEARFKMLFDTAPVSLTVTDHEGRLMAINQELTRVFGHTQAEVLGKRTDEIAFWPDPHERKRIWDSYRRDGIVQGQVAKVSLRQGRPGDVAIWSSTVTLDGKPAIIWALLDMTEEFDAKRALKELNTSLETRVQRRSAELEEANADLSRALDTLKRTQHDLISSEKMASLGSLVAGIAHELNTPIGNSLLAATSLSDRVAGFRRQLEEGTLKRSVLNEHLSDVVLACGLISGSLHRAANLIASFKQVAVDQTNDELRMFDLRAVLEDTLATFTPRLRRANCAGKVEVEGALSLHSYPGSLCQVINNLITNALVHAFEQRPSAAIAIRAREAGAEVVIEFADDGVGMAEDVLHRVFDPFFTTRMGRGGTGLGMNIVYNIVTGVLGGRIDIATALGEGTTVTIAIPKQAPLREAGKKALA